MTKSEILEKANAVYEERVRVYRENGKTDYEAGRVDGCLILIQVLERFLLDDSQLSSNDYMGEA